MDIYEKKKLMKRKNINIIVELRNWPIYPLGTMVYDLEKKLINTLLRFISFFIKIKILDLFMALKKPHLKFKFF